MTVDLLPHQKRALAWMLHREQAGTKPAVPGGLLADDQGLGKTITTIALLLSHPPPQVTYLCTYKVPRLVSAAGSVCKPILRKYELYIHASGL